MRRGEGGASGDRAAECGDLRPGPARSLRLRLSSAVKGAWASWLLALLLPLSACAMRGAAVEPASPPAEEPEDAEQDQVRQIKYLRLELQLDELRKAGADAQADSIAAKLGADPTPESIEEASVAVRAWLGEEHDREPAYCADPELSQHMFDLIRNCEHLGRCQDVTDAEPYFASDAQYKRLVALMPKTTVFFRTGRHTLDRFSQRKLHAFVERDVDLAQAHSYVFVIGRASKVGNYQRNLVLAISRARAVVDALRGKERVMHDIGFTAYARYTIYVTKEDGSVLGEDGKLKLSENALNQSATVFLYECPQTVKRWKADFDAQ